MKEVGVKKKAVICEIITRNGGQSTRLHRNRSYSVMATVPGEGEGADLGQPPLSLASNETSVFYKLVVGGLASRRNDIEHPTVPCLQKSHDSHESEE